MMTETVSHSAEFDLADYCRQCHVAEPDTYQKQCLRFYSLLEAVNRHTNLTRITDIAEFWNKHIADSISITRFFPDLAQEHLSILDIGCGAGIPSIPLKLAFDELAVTAIDSVRKKTDFVASASTDLGIDVTVIHGRSKELNSRKEFQGVFDVITARAVGNPAVIVNESRRMLKDNGRYLLYKTPASAENEMPELVKKTEKFGFSWQTSPAFSLPGGDGDRQFLVGQRR